MQHFDSIIFDLDGTLWDASDTCAEAWNIGLRNADVVDRQITADHIRKVSGLPFEECVSVLFSDLSSETIEQLSVEIDSQERVGLMASGGHLYEGVIAGIDMLAQKYKLFIVSNCQSWYLQLFLERHEMRRRFVATSCHGDTGIGKSAMISRVCDTHGLVNPIYIGDTMGDQTASLQAGVKFGFASYGFGESSESHCTFSSFTELAEWFGRGKAA